MAKSYQQNPDSNSEVEKLKAQLDALSAEKKKLEDSNNKLSQAISQGVAAVPVNATFTASIVEQGEEVKKKFGFVDGAHFLWIDGRQMPTEVVVALATGAKINEKELSSAPTLGFVIDANGKDNGRCKAALQHLADVGYSQLVELK